MAAASWLVRPWTTHLLAACICATACWRLDLLDLRLPAEVVVLATATCHSAQRAIAGRGLEQLPGDDLFGLPAMLPGRRPSPAGALWRVDDSAASTIVSEFHLRTRHKTDAARARRHT